MGEVNEAIATRLKRLDELFTLPDLIIKINELVRSSKTTASDIAQTISNDMALSAKVLKLVNSSFYGFDRKITSINYAIVILGFTAIRNVVMSIFLKGKCQQVASGFMMADFWKYAVNCAVATDYLAGKIGYQQRDDAFMAGLMNKIGIIIMNQHWTDEFASIIAKSKKDNVLLITAERELLNYDHYEIGAALLDKWNLPTEIINVCRHITMPRDHDSQLCWIAHLASVLVRAMNLGTPGDPIMPDLSPHALAKLKLQREQLPEIMENIAKAAKHATAFLNEM